MEILRFVFVGLGAGAIYAILAQGLIVIYRGSGLVNFSQGAIAMAGAYIYYEFTVKQGQPRFLALLIALVSCAVIGLLIQLVVLRPMRQSSALARVVATLAITVVLQSLAFVIYGYDPLPVPSLLPTDTVRVFSDQLTIGADTLIIFAIAGAVTIGLAIMYGRMPFGRATAAVAENQLVAASLGHSPTTIATLNWVLGSVLAGLAGVLIAPIIFLEPTVLVLLVVPALAAAMLAEFSSFGLTFALTIGLGIASAQINRWVPDSGWATTAPFLVIVIALTLRGSVLPLRSFVLDRPPRVGDARVRPLLVAVCFVLATLAVSTATPNWSLALTINFALAIVCLSSVVIIGYAGQLSLAASTMAGLSAVVAAHMSGHAPFLVVLGLGALAAGCCGALIGIPALRTRGVTLAIATLALSAAISSTILLNNKYNGGADGILVEKPQIFGWDIDPLFHGNRYAFVVLVFLTVIALAVANLRRGRTGRRLLAIRANERAAATLGVPTSALKAYAFTLSATIAGVGGVLIGFSATAVQINAISYFTVFSGILIVAVTAVGGVGYIGGALMGSTFLAGGIGNELLRNWSGSATYLPLIGGVVLIITLVTQPAGMFEFHRAAFAQAGSRLKRLIVGTRSTEASKVKGRHYAVEEGQKITPQALRITGLSVSFGGVHAVRDVDLDVQPGEIHGVIGPNGAGKTTVIDAITGLVHADRGEIWIGTVEISGWSARRRATAGLSRSFQSLELFDDLTILDNLAVASERGQAWRCLTDLAYPGIRRLSPVAEEAIQEFELGPILGRTPSEISFGQRKTVAIARAMASTPSVLLLDEPAAGLDENEAAELSRLIVRVSRKWGCGVLLIEHKVDIITAICDRVTVLDSGKVLATGAVADVMANPHVIEAYLGTSLTTST